ncbi:nitrite reductase (NO-forming) [Fibrella aestuarina BUZ 2]|uniref:Nitrite reductase (NO-forming) n=2 Tax=Fibrella TaxID=861914 RepID=I0KCP3_9BACT|nr:nitrite reductase (NO-forming) [Fibrella aestuarina BUZ 2]
MKRRLLLHRLFASLGWSAVTAPLCIVHCTLFILSACQSDDETKRQKYITEGIMLYRNNCANCHQVDGAGLAGLYPPLANSDYLKANKNAVICSIRHGQQGPIVVNGKTYNRPMPAQLQFSALEVAEITTYIYSQWGDDKRLVTGKEAEAILATCKK